MQLDVEVVRAGRGDGAHVVPRAGARAGVDVERDEDHPLRGGGGHARVVRVPQGLVGADHHADGVAEEVRVHAAGLVQGLLDDGAEARVLQRQEGIGDGGVQPALEAVAPRARLPARGARRVVAVLQALEVAAHGAGAPARVVEGGGDAIPVGVVRDQGDERVVRRAAAQRPRAGIEHAALRGEELLVPALLRLVGVGADEEVPAHLRILGRRGVEGRHVARPRGLRIAARLQQGHLEAGARQVARERPPARAGSDDHVVDLVGVAGRGARRTRAVDRRGPHARWIAPAARQQRRAGRDPELLEVAPGDHAARSCAASSRIARHPSSESQNSSRRRSAAAPRSPRR